MFRVSSLGRGLLISLCTMMGLTHCVDTHPNLANTPTKRLSAKEHAQIVKQLRKLEADHTASSPSSIK